jgi:hypothetical protein
MIDDTEDNDDYEPTLLFSGGPFDGQQFVAEPGFLLPPAKLFPFPDDADAGGYVLNELLGRYEWDDDLKQPGGE